MGRCTIPAAAGLLALVALAACRDDLASGPHPAADRPRLQTTSTSFTVSDVANEALTPLRPAGITFATRGGPVQTARLSVTKANFPIEGSTFLVVSSGNAANFDNPNFRTTAVEADCFERGQVCDRGGVDLEFALPEGAQSVELNVRYFSWDDNESDDEFSVQVLDEDGRVSRTVLSLTTDREFPRGDEVVGGSMLRYGDALHRVIIRASDAVNGTLRLRLEASDTDNGLFDSGALIDNLRVLGVGDDVIAPVASLTRVSPTPVPCSQGTTLTSTFTDLGGVAAGEYSVNDGPFSAMGGAFGATTVTASKTLPAVGCPTTTVRTLCARAQDARGNSGAPECVEQAVYDPSAGYATGSGAFRSRQGAYGVVDASGNNPDYGIAGRAQFGFSSRFQQGATIPSGSTRFNFRAAGLEFRATVYDWLVVSGPHARYKGRGRLTLNNQPVLLDVGDRVIALGGAEDYGFLVAATDGHAIGGSGADKIRIKIWRMRDEVVVYDNHRMYSSTDTDLGDTAVPVTGLTSGRIMIRR